MPRKSTTDAPNAMQHNAFCLHKDGYSPRLWARKSAVVSSVASGDSGVGLSEHPSACSRERIGLNEIIDEITR